MFESKYWIAIAAVLIIATLSASCYAQSNNGFDYSIEEALNLWQNKEAIIIDVRTQGEYAEGHIPGVANIPLDQLEKRTDEIPKDQKVLLICRSGNRSAKGTTLLRNSGFDNVFNITGGMLAWQGPVTK